MGYSVGLPVEWGERVDDIGATNKRCGLSTLLHFPEVRNALTLQSGETYHAYTVRRITYLDWQTHPFQVDFQSYMPFV